MEDNGRVLLFGIDGATFKIIEPMIKEGGLPNFRRLMDDGASGILESTVPAVSPVAWTSFMTGKRPGKHNIYDFQGRYPGSYKFKVNSARDRMAKPLWVYLSEIGAKVSVAGVTMTYPPDEVEGEMVSGLGAPTSGGAIFTSPPELSGEITQTLGEYNVIHKSRPDLRQRAGREQFMREMMQLIEYRVELYKHLMKKGPRDFMMYFFIDTDGAQHNFWKYMDRKFKGVDEKDRELFGDAIHKVYEKVDWALGEIIGAAGDGVDVMLMSDHGFGPLYRTVALNVWLARQGLLKFKPRGVADVTRALYGRAMGRLFRDRKKILLEDISDLIDWGATKAYYNGTVGNVFINLRGRDPEGIVSQEEYAPLRRSIAEGLLGIVDPDSGEKAVERVYMREEVFTGENLELSPDLVVEFRHGYGVFSGLMVGLSESSPVIGDSGIWSGDHVRDGIFVGCGPSFRKGVRIANSSIMDIAPTVLYILDKPIPGEMDGRVIEDSIDAGLIGRRRPVIVSEGDAGVDGGGQGELSEEEQQLIVDQLRDLGYME